MRSIAVVLLSLALIPDFIHAARKDGRVSRSAKNPIRKVVTMLQSMQKKVKEEGSRETELYNRFMCYCKTSGGDLGQTISSAETKIPAVSSEIRASKAALVQTKEDLNNAQKSRSDAQKAMASASAIRKKEAAAFAAEEADSTTNIAALAKAVAAVDKGMASGFLQTGDAQVLGKLVHSRPDMSDEDRQALVAFLSGTQGSQYVPQGGQIAGILKQLGDEGKKNLADATAAENAAIAAFEELMAAKAKEVAVLSAS